MSSLKNVDFFLLHRSACPQNTFKSTRGQGECIPCPTGGVTYIEGSSHCACAAGYTLSGNGSCTGNYSHHRVVNFKFAWQASPLITSPILHCIRLSHENEISCMSQCIIKHNGKFNSISSYLVCLK